MDIKEIARKVDYEHVKKQLGYGIQTESKDNAINAIESLQSRIAELENDRDMWKRAFENGGTETMQKQLAASQLRETQLREALQTYIDEHEECQDADDWMAMMCSIEAHHVADEAIALPADTNALDAYVSEKVKEEMKDVELYRKGMFKANEYAESVTQQRDLAVEAMTLAANQIRKCDYTPARSTLLVALSTIKGK